jgi:apolipoprotein N-acyltransferase
MILTKTQFAAGKVFAAAVLLLLIGVLKLNPVGVLVGWLIGAALELLYFYWRES